MIICARRPTEARQAGHIRENTREFWHRFCAVEYVSAIPKVDKKGESAIYTNWIDKGLSHTKCGEFSAEVGPTSRINVL